MQKMVNSCLVGSTSSSPVDDLRFSVFSLVFSTMVALVFTKNAQESLVGRWGNYRFLGLFVIQVTWR